MSEQDDDAAEMDHAEEVLMVEFVADDKPSEVLEPSKEAFYLPAAPIATQKVAVLSAMVPVAAMRCDHLDVGALEFGIQAIGIISGVADQMRWRFLDQEFPGRGSDQRDFMRRSTCRGYGDRKTSAVCNCYDLRPLTTLGFAHAEPPFFAGAKAPSMKASWRSNFPLAFRSSASASSTPRITPEATRC